MFRLITINCVVVFISLVVHYEFLLKLTHWVPRLSIPHRLRLFVFVAGTLIAHAVEIWVFGLAYFVVSHWDQFGELTGDFTGQFLEYIYFSFTTYTSLGIGDIKPTGYVRFLTGIEALTGLVLITWTASFLFVEMQKNWRTNGNRYDGCT